MKLLLLLISLTNVILAITPLDSKLFFSENPIKFNPPIVKKNNIEFIPVRSLTDYFGGNIKVSKKTYIYTIELMNKKFKIKTNSNKLTFEGRSKSFQNKPFTYKTRLYVPLNDFLLLLGYSTQKANGDIYAYQSENSNKVSGPIINLNYDKGIKYLTASKIYLPISKKTLPINKTRVHGKTLIDSSGILENLGYNLKYIDNYVLLKKDSATYSFKSGSKQVKISDGKAVLTKDINYTPYVKNQKLYVHFPSFLNDLGFDYDLKNNQIIILKKLNKITFEADNSILIHKNSRLSISKFYYLDQPSRAYTNFPYTKCPNNSIIEKNKFIKNITFGQHDTTCRMVLTLNTNKKIASNKITPSITELNFKNYISEKKQKVANPVSKIKSSNSLKGKVIVIDPGHGGVDPGAVTKNNDYEKYYTLDISNRLKKVLISKGAKVVMLRSKDTNPSLYQRVKRINSARADLLVSVHVNSFIRSSAKGTETYYYKQKDKKAAYHIQKQLVNTLKLRNNGIKRAKMYVLKNTSIPGVLIEPCFMTNPKEYSLLKTNSFKNKIAIGTANGIEDYFKSI